MTLVISPNQPASPKVARNYALSSYVENIDTYDAAQYVHPGRLDLQNNAAIVLIRHEPLYVGDVGCSKGGFSTPFILSVLNGLGKNGMVYCIDSDYKAVTKLRETYDGDHRVRVVAEQIENYAKNVDQPHRNIFDALYMGGMWTDIKVTKDERVPIMENVRQKLLSPRGIVILDEEIITEHDLGNEAQKLGALWGHHGQVIGLAILYAAHYRAISQNATDDFYFGFLPELSNGDFRKVVLAKSRPDLLAKAYFQLAREELHAFASGVNNYGDHKSTLVNFKDELVESGFRAVRSKRIWPLDTDLIIDQDSFNLVNNLVDNKYPVRSKLWDYTSAKIIQSVLRMGDDPFHTSFEEACQIIKECAERIYQEVGDPFANLSALEERFGIRLRPAGNVDFGVHMFVTKK